MSEKQADPFSGFWDSYVRHADEDTRKLLASSDIIHHADALNRDQLEKLSEVMDVYLRSPAFLRAMSQNLDAIITAKQQERFLPKSGSQLSSTAAAEDARRQASAPCGIAHYLELVRPLAEQASDLWDRFVSTAEGSQDSTPYDVVYQEGTLRVLRYRSESAVTVVEPVVVCFSLVNRPYVMDLQPDRSVMRQLLQQGLDVYLIDWGVPLEADHTLCLHDYICGRMKRVADRVCDHSRCAQISLLGYCMGGTMSTMFSALQPQQVRNLILLATPIDFAGSESLLNLWTREEFFDVDALIDAFGNCPGALLQLCFQHTKPIHNYVQKYLNLYQRSDDHAFLGNFFAVERWANDNIPVAGETFREFVKLLYQRNLLVKGNMQLDTVPIDLKLIACPVLILTADADHLVPPDSTLALKHLVASTEIEHLRIPTGHIGLAVSSKAHQQLWPKAASWIVKHSTQRSGG